ncbi:MAG: 16S rRNA (adenine(1518)-N(6)/adenine(1519)-N(6))-dimethyltransferase RsmA [Ignavibacteriales bacterium]|nr:16S rRNA (adenine(1518)-N(6)/adenine(1519)-N(6))-dimethyltransferase RsmA [Ignavibacteriales bacterium]
MNVRYLITTSWFPESTIELRRRLFALLTIFHLHWYSLYMERSSHRPKKSLGQNFLHDENIVRKIIRSLQLQPEDLVLEIGPGEGALTTHLVAALPHLTAVELDDRLVGALQTRFGEKLTLIHGNVLKVDLQSLQQDPGHKLRIVGNIPYNITSPILFWIIDQRTCVADAMLMMQREVAQRLSAVPRTKDYGILSVFAQYYSTPKMQFLVSPSSFVPVPEVFSAVMHLDFAHPATTLADDDTLFRLVVRGTFGKRRKTLRNGLKGLGVSNDILQSLSTRLDQRPEELSVPEFVLLANELSALGASITLPSQSQLDS